MIENRRWADPPEPTPRLRLVACGALARELMAIINQLPQNVVELTCLPAAWHHHLKKIVPGLKTKVKAGRKAGRTLFVIYGDCGTGGQLDAFLDEQNIQGIPNPIAITALWAMPS